MLAFVCLVCAAPTANAADGKRDSTAPSAYVIGDSVLLGASSDLEKLGIEVDSVSGRRPTRLIGALRKLPEDGRPLIVHLGTNGPFSRDVCERFRASLHDSRPVVFVTISAPRPWVTATNHEIRRCARKITGATLLPWHRIANQKPESLYPDGIHLTPTGIATVVQEITQALARAKSAR